MPEAIYTKTLMDILNTEKLIIQYSLKICERFSTQNFALCKAVLCWNNSYRNHIREMSIMGCSITTLHLLTLFVRTVDMNFYAGVDCQISNCSGKLLICFFIDRHNNIVTYALTQNTVPRSANTGYKTCLLT